MSEGGNANGPPPEGWMYPEIQEYRKPATAKWRSLWIQINGVESWDANPFAWVYDLQTVGSSA